jgi:predicted ATPase
MNYLHIKNFKCFSDREVNINNFTILVGINGAGKSSVIQALLLLRETKIGAKQISLNGSYGLMLGTSASVLNQNAESEEISLIYRDAEDAISSAIYKVDSSIDQLWLKITNCNIRKRSVFGNDRFYYLGAERIGPRISNELLNLPYLNVGIHGEYTAQVISSNGGREKVDPERMLIGTKDPNLQSQVNFWLDKILPGVNISAITDFSTLQAQIKISNEYTSSNPIMAPNIGFGISYVLPIITTGLIAQKGAMFIVENPEAHLHPAAQTAIGEFLGMVAQSGVIVIVETHSEHIINGSQIYVARHEDFIGRVTINNFSLDNEKKQPKIDALTINSNGEISEWPEGFLDQAQKDYIKLSNFKNNV